MPRVYVRKRETKYTLQDLYNAVKDVEEKRRTYRQAAETYNIPTKVIFDRIKGRKISMERMGAGVKKALPENVEKYIVSCLKTRAQMGHPCQKEELKLLVKEYVDSKKLKTPFKDNKPGDDWYINFMKRNPELSLKKPEHLQKSRKDARKPYIVYDFYHTLQQVVNDNHLEDKPGFIFNCDESGFQSDPSRVRGIGEKGKPLTRVSGGSGRESTTVLACVSAEGHVMPPLIVFKGAAVQARWTSEKAYENTVYAATKNGWMEEPVFFNWFSTKFIPYVNKLREDQNKPTQKALLIYDGHASHISLRIVEEAEKANIILLKFPSHLTDRIQPLDKCVFGPVKKAWDKKLVENGIKQMGLGTGRLSRSQFTEILGEVYNIAMKTENIKSGFSTTGLYPVNPSKFPKHLFKPEDLQLYTNIINQFNYPDIQQETEHILTEQTERVNRQTPNTTEIEEIYRSLNLNNPQNEHIITQQTESETSFQEVEIPKMPESHTQQIEVDQATSFQEVEIPKMPESHTQQIEVDQATSFQEVEIPKMPESHTQQIEVDQADKQNSYITTECDRQQLQITSNTISPSTTKSYNVVPEDNDNSSALISQILKLISLDTKTADHIKRKITSAFMNSVTLDEEIESPSKRQLEDIFSIAKPVKKAVVPRLKQCAFGEVLTTNEVKERLKKAEEEKRKKKTVNKIQKKVEIKENEKGKKRSKKFVNAREPRTKKQRLKERNADMSTSEEDEADPVEYNESDNSDYIIDHEFETEFEEPKKDKNPECGNFVLVTFKGGKRMTTIYKYLCIVDSVDDEEMEIQVTSLKCMDSSKTLFTLNDNDKSDVPYDDVLGIVSEPRIILRGERMLYKFEKPIDVFEQAYVNNSVFCSSRNM